MKRWSMFCIMLVMFGVLDLLTSVFGIGLFGATEKNTFLTTVTGMNLAAFCSIKLAAVIGVGIIFYKAGKIQQFAGTGIRVQSHFLHLAYSLSLFALVTAVTNNVLVVARLV
jgi:hypothetical protein